MFVISTAGAVVIWLSAEVVNISRVLDSFDAHRRLRWLPVVDSIAISNLLLGSAVELKAEFVDWDG